MATLVLTDCSRSANKWPNLRSFFCKLGCESNVFVSAVAAQVAPNVPGYVPVLPLTTVCWRLGWIWGPHTAAWLKPPSALAFTGAAVDAGGSVTCTQLFFLFFFDGGKLWEGCFAFQHACNDCTRRLLVSGLSDRMELLQHGGRFCCVCWDRLRLVFWWLNMEAVLSKLTFGAAPQSLCGSV